MIYIIARNAKYAKEFANGQEYTIIDTATQLFGKTDHPIHVLMDWQFGKNTCQVRKLKLMIKAMGFSPRATIVRHDLLVSML